MTAEDRLKLGNMNFISGHIFLEDIKKLPYIVNYNLISIFRDPYRRLASHIRYMDRYNQPEYETQFNHLGDELKIVVKSIEKVDFERPDDLEALFASLPAWGRAAFENCQTRFLVCDLASVVASPYGDLPEGAFDLALERLEALDVIGISEALDTTIEQLAVRLGTPFAPRAPVLNTASSHRKLNHNDPHIREVMRPLLGVDELLYTRAKALFDQRGGAPTESPTGEARQPAAK